jgi:phosphoglycerate dehydrogenase-like enzyme
MRRPVNFAELDALINVLPLTEQTRGILARRCSTSFPQAPC